MMEEEEEQGQEKEEEQEVRVQVPYLVTESGIAEETWDRKNAPLFAVRKFGSSEITYVGEIETDQTDMKGRKIIYTPCDNSHLRKGLVLVPEKAEPASFDEVFQEGYELVKAMYDFAPEKEQEIRLLTAIAQASWFLDRMLPQNYQLAGIGVYAPIIAIRARSGSGKNRLLNALRLQSYRPFYDQTTVKIPSVYRPLDLWRGTLCLDEADITGNETNELVKLLNCRATGTPISRQNPDNPKVSEAFWNFGLTIVTQRRAWQDDALENRSIPFYSEKSQKELSTVELDEWVLKGIELQNKLLYLRLMFWDQVKIDKSARIPGVKDHRLTASVLPLLALSKFAPSITQDLADILLEIERKRKEVRAQSADGVIVNVLWDHIERGLVGTWNTLVYVGKERAKQDNEDVVIPLSSADIAEQLNWKSKQVRMVIHSLQIGNGPPKIRVAGKIYRPVWFAHKTLESLFVDFIPDYEPGSLEKKLVESGIPVAHVADVADYMCVALSEKEGLEKNDTQRKSATPATSATEPELETPKKTPESSEIASNSNILLAGNEPDSLHIKKAEGSTEMPKTEGDIKPPSEPLCPPWIASEEWSKLSNKEKERVLEGRVPQVKNEKLIGIGGAFWETVADVQEQGAMTREGLIKELCERCFISKETAERLIELAISQGELIEEGSKLRTKDSIEKLRSRIVRIEKQGEGAGDEKER